MKRKQLILPLIFAVLLAVYCTVVFLVVKEFTTSFWVSFGFILAAFIIMMLCYMFVSKESRKKQVVGMPVTVLSSLYFTIEFIMGTIFMFFNVSFVAVFIPQLILFALFLIILIPALLSEKNYKDQ